LSCLSLGGAASQILGLGTRRTARDTFRTCCIWIDLLNIAVRRAGDRFQTLASSYCYTNGDANSRTYWPTYGSADLTPEYYGIAPIPIHPPIRIAPRIPINTRAVD